MRARTDRVTGGFYAEGVTWPGPLVLGRGLVVRPGAEIPEPWTSAPMVVITPEILSDPAATEELVDRLHRAWVERTPAVIQWAIDDDALTRVETTDEPPWAVGATFLFPLERLRFLCFTNAYDARNGPPIWWWAHKAAAVGASPGGPADVLLTDGTPAWIDGGPRHPLDPLDHAVIHGETVDLGKTTPIPSPTPSDDEALAPDQLEAVGHLAGSARIIAPAGSGKTRTLAARLHHLVTDRGVEPEIVTAVAYNARAAAELRERLGADRRTVRTIHSLGWEILREVHPGTDLIGEAEVRHTLGRFVSVPRRANADPMGPYLEALDEVRVALRSPRRVESQRDDVPGFADAFDAYRRRLYDTGRVDHGEQVYGAVEALLADPALRKRWQARCRHLLVDEFQDLTPAYLLLLRLVASPRLQVFGVGDDDQVIYGYAGADPGFLIDFADLFPGAATHALVTNYRCPPAVVEGALHLLGYNERRIPKTILAADRPHEDATDLTVERLDGDTLAVEAANRVRRWIDEGTATDGIAVLARVNAALIPVKAALVDAGIPTDDQLDRGSLRRTTLRSLFSWIRVAAEPKRISRGDALAVIRRPSRGLSRVGQSLIVRRHLDTATLHDLGEQLDGKQAQRWSDWLGDVHSAIAAAKTRDAHELLRTIVDVIGLGSAARTLDSGRSNAAKSGHHDDLVAVRRAAALHPDLATFLPWLVDVVSQPSTPGGVTLSSVHRVKGMEWPRVVVFAADEGTLPHDLADDTEEERRILHVAITRSSTQTVVVADRDRPSRFLGELDGSAPRHPKEQPRRASVTAPRQPSVAVGDQLRISGGYEGTAVAVDRSSVTVALGTGAELAVPLADVVAVLVPAVPTDNIVDALKAWRLDTSTRLGVPAYVVMHDSTLIEIARQRPRDDAALLRVQGIGARKLDDYGDDILSIVEAASTDD